MSSAFKTLYSSMINNDGNFAKVSSAGKKIKCFVKESFPYFLVTDNHFYVPCYFTKKAIDDFKSKNAGVNITDLKSKVVELDTWTLEMAKVDSASVFTSYAGIEVRLVVSSFKLGGKDKVLLSRYPVNIYRDDEMKTLFNAYHHRQLKAKVTCKDCLPDLTKKGDGVMSFASGDRFQYGFKVGGSQTVDLVSIFKGEKGAGALAKLQKGGSSGGVTIKGPKIKSAAKKSAQKSGIKSASKHIMKASAVTAKKSVAKIGGKVPKMATPAGTQGSAQQTPKVSMKNFAQMKKFLQKQQGRK